VAGAGRPQAALFTTLSGLVAAVGADCLTQLEALLVKLVSWMEGARGHSVECVASCARAITLRLGAAHVAPHADRLLQAYIGVLQAHHAEHGCLDAETLAAIGALAKALGLQFAGAMPSLWPILQKAMADIDEPDVCLAGLAAFQEVVRAVGPAVQSYAAGFLELATRGLRFRGCLDLRVRVDFISCVADIAIAMGAALPVLPEVMRLLGEEVADMHGRQQEAVSEACDSSRHIQHSNVISMILKAYEALFSGLDSGAGVSMQQALRSFLAGVMEFLCCFARTMQSFATSHTWSLGVKLVGRIASAFPTDLAALAASSVEVQQLVQDLHSFSRDSWDQSLKPLSAPLAGVLHAATLVR